MAGRTSAWLDPTINSVSPGGLFTQMCSVTRVCIEPLRLSVTPCGFECVREKLSTLSGPPTLNLTPLFDLCTPTSSITVMMMEWHAASLKGQPSETLWLFRICMLLIAGAVSWLFKVHEDLNLLICMIFWGFLGQMNREPFIQVTSGCLPEKHILSSNQR